MGYELDTTEKINSVIKDNEILIDTYNIIYYKVNDWEAIMEYMLNNPYSEHKEQLNKDIVKEKQQDEKEEKERAEKEEKEEKERLEREAQERKEQETSVLDAYNKVPIGGILLSGSNRHIVFQGDKIELRSDDSGIIKSNIPDQDFFIEDVRGVSVHLAKNVALNALTSGPISDSLSFIRFDLKGENVQAEPQFHPYTVIVSSTDIGYAHGFKFWFDSKLKEIRAENKQKTTSSATSNADELLKFSELLEKGMISQEEFDAQKKKILGL